MRPLVARPDGSLEVLGGMRAAARSGQRLVELRPADTIPVPDGATLAHLPERRVIAFDRGGPEEIESELLPVAAVLPFGYLRTLLPASRPRSGSERLPLYGYGAIAEHRGSLRVAAMATDAFEWWAPRGRGRRDDLDAAIAAARAALPGNRLVEHLATCATE